MALSLGGGQAPKGLGGIAYTFPDKLDDETIDYYLSPLVSTPERMTLVNASAIGLDPSPLAGIEGALKRTKVPARIVWGTGDDIFWAAGPEYLDRTVTNSQGICCVPGAKLFFPEEFPDLIAKEVPKAAMDHPRDIHSQFIQDGSASVRGQCTFCDSTAIAAVDSWFQTMVVGPQ